MRTKLTPLLWAALFTCLPLVSTGATTNTAARDETASTAPPSPALVALITTALDHNPRVQAARAALNAAQARTRAADNPLYNPELEFDHEATDVRTTSVGLAQAIDWADKRGARAHVAQGEQEAVAAELAAVRLEVAEELLTALVTYRTAQDLVELAAQREEILERAATLAERQYKAGDLGQVELDLAHLAAAQAKLQRAQATAARIDAQQTLAAVLGERRREWPALPTTLPFLNPHALDTETLVQELPALRVQQGRVAAALATVSLRARERRPDPVIGVRAGREDSETLTGVSLSIPLYVRNPLRAEVEAANAEATQAERNAQDVYQRAKARLITAAERYQLVWQAWADWERLGRPSLESQAVLLERLWQAGELSTADYLVQLRQIVDTQASALEVRGRLWQAWFEWLAASAQLDAWLGLPAAP